MSRLKLHFGSNMRKLLFLIPAVLIAATGCAEPDMNDITPPNIPTLLSPSDGAALPQSDEP